MRRLVAILLACAASCPWLCAESALVHPLVPESSLGVERIRDMFLGRITTWSDGRPVVLVLIDDPAADGILQQVVGRDRARLIRGWKRLVYTGNGAMPLLASGAGEAMALVARHPGAIALVDHLTPDARCRLIPVSGLPVR